MPGDLGKKSPADPLQAEGEGGVFQGAFVAQLPQHPEEGLGLFRGEALHHRVDGGGAVAELGGGGHRLFRVGGVGDEGYFHGSSS